LAHFRYPAYAPSRWTPINITRRFVRWLGAGRSGRFTRHNGGDPALVEHTQDFRFSSSTAHIIFFPDRAMTIVE